MVDLKSPGSIPSLKERLEMSEQLDIAESFLWKSVESFLGGWTDSLRSMVFKMLKVGVVDIDILPASVIISKF